jgi:hypothetical protein
MMIIIFLSFGAGVAVVCTHCGEREALAGTFK